MSAILSFQDFSFRYKHVSNPTLKKINLDIQAGEMILIAGPSGSGKSTLAHCINGLIPFSYPGEITGELFIRGVAPQPKHLSDISRVVGTILQDQDGQFVGLTVGEDVAFAFENEGIPLEQMKIEVKHALNMVDMLPWIDRSPHECSGGQKQRVSLAGILSMSCDVLLFDEPLANLDPASAQQAMALIVEIGQRTGKTVIIIEHRIEDVLRQPIDRMVIMDQGSIQAIGTPDELLATSILRDVGLREPLYVEALKHLQPEWKPTDRLSNIRHILSPSLTQALHNWCRPVPVTTDADHKSTVLSLENVRFAYNHGPEILQGITFDLHEGEIVSILGNNGAGKSTLAHLITGMYTPTNGDITLNGKSIRHWSIKKRGQPIGYVMQNPNQMITQQLVTEEVALGLKMKGTDLKQIDEKVREVLETCGLYPYRNWPISALSYGQKKRVTVAAILALEPQVIILDEPTAGQDYRHYTEFMQFIHSLSQQGIAFLLITHDLHLAMEYSDRAIVLSQGRIIADDKVTRILTDSSVIKQANLAEPSLSTLARQAQLDPERLLTHFIQHVRQQRGRLTSLATDQSTTLTGENT
ncbi:ABC transporter ATP-binding protein [Desmospora activa]|uniref:Energy-coupling factor transport system ATP-binding protein n=1 Tax=Desmospora activa DSM 45169 TaxID=1121389 RepID=A0A2T4ZC15_9BACL|nr:ABC transporter ATP-binding protein [Desmospora activa]PTM59402.1 energy-coupling factor transport system ATP-binding protein [Desmospora activa DSM 45169]